MQKLNNNSTVNYLKKLKRVLNSQIMDIQRTISSLPCTNTNRDVNKANLPCEYMQKVKNRLGIFDDNEDLGHLSMSKS
jgi:hypothetical protein